MSVQGGIAVSTVPTLSQWGLIAMAAILGIVGFMVMRRRKAAA
ncbi:MAG: IPTL-CTERM sorting domain-containing protein [Deltaproteobacteria bacterium]|nr:IPTL-CTERM sorting domain-containing protein [Deltaproteobacteria bacterium]